MPVLDGNFEAFVTNLGKYNEGMLVGEWVKLPTTEEEMQKVFERIGIGKQDEFGQPYEEWFITDYECPIYGVQKMLGEYESLDKLNYLAALIDELSLSDQEKLVAIMEAGCDEVSDIDDLINLTFNLDCYDIMPGINDESDLGYYYAHEAGIYSEKDLGPLANYIDYERYGRDIAMDEQGRFTDEGYVRVASERWDRQFNGELDDIPDEYRITGSGEAAERDSTIAVLIVEPGKEPYVKEIDSGLESLQHEVGGYIEAIYPYEDPVALVCNEEGKLEGLPLNRALRDEDGDIYDVVAGTFMVVGLTDDSFGSLTVEQMQKFSDHFKVPEQFAKLGDKIVAIPMISKEQQKQESVEQKDFEMNADTSGLTVAGHIGTWHTIDQHEVGGHSFYLMEHDTYGDETACIIVDERGKLVLDDVYNGFDDDTLRLLDLEVKEVPEMLRDDREGYEKFYENFGRAIGFGIAGPDGLSRKEALQDLLLFYSSTEKKLVTLREYVDRMPESQKYIYYAAGENVYAIDHLPQTELLKDKNYEILYLTGETDEFVLQMLGKYADKEFRSIVDGELDLGDEEEKVLDEKPELMQFVKETLGDKIKEARASRRLKTHPVCMTAGEGLSFEMEKYFKNFQMPTPVKADRILELNTDHPAVQAMEAAMTSDRAKAELYAKILYDQALLIAGLPLEDPSEYTDLVAELMK